MNIIPNQGASKIRFGMQPHHVKEVMGNQLTWEEWMGGNVNDGLYYPGIIFIFDKMRRAVPSKDANLVEIWAHGNNKALIFQSIPLHQMTQTKFTQILESERKEYVLREGVEFYVKEWNLEISFNEDGSFDQLWLYGYPQ